LLLLLLCVQLQCTPAQPLLPQCSSTLSNAVQAVAMLLLLLQ
jgi:hypothetical protein